MNNPTRQPPSTTTTKKKKRAKRSVHVTALDGVVNVNSLFTIAIFVGLAMASPAQLQSLNERKECQPGKNTAKMLVVFEILSFSFFLFSSLVAQSIKLSLNLQGGTADDDDSDDTSDSGSRSGSSYAVQVDEKWLEVGVMTAALSSVMGCLFLLVSMVNVIEIKLGVLTCNADSTIVSVVFLVPLSVAGTVIYIFAAISNYMAAHKRRHSNTKQQP